ncbi:hypothetical protein Aau02nite_46460 [Amorphoplanes auranticolor]|uniref:Uncharacterized protein n=1 Tax=Actinoplanes auranticolor TaxID=47988 RepID=A0A919VMB6_9ACTN|nr:hypothetical protein Aau02nite_46460 [Actinoplanes auranticolor]
MRKQADPGWDEIEDRGLLSVCEPVLAETLLIANSSYYAKTEQEIATGAFAGAQVVAENCDMNWTMPPIRKTMPPPTVQ